MKFIFNIKPFLCTFFIGLFLQFETKAQVNIVKADSITQDSLLILQKSGKKAKYNFADAYTKKHFGPVYNSPFNLKDRNFFDYNFNYGADGKVDIKSDLKQKNSQEKAAYTLPESVDFKQYQALQNKMVMNQMFRQYAAASEGISDVSGRGLRPKLTKNKLFDKLAGQEIDLKPNGFVSVEIGGFSQKSDNPLIPIALRNQTQFVFNQQANFNLTGGIGDLMKINANFDTKASFNLQNQFKIDYRAQEEDIVQKVEAGNISFNLPTTLITGVSNLMGVKTGLRFGKLDMQLVASQQRSKVESIYIKGGKETSGGAGGKGTDIRCDNYDENRHFFLSHFFRDNYEKWLKNIPVNLSGVNITRVEVYVTNRTGNTETLRNIAGFADMAEPSRVGNTAVNLKAMPQPAADNFKANDLFDKIKGVNRDVNSLNSALAGFGYNRGVDYEVLRGAKKLNPTDYRLNAELGYVSLLSPLKNDEILAVAYEYTYRGRSYKVGELTEEYQSQTEDKVIYMKMLKSSTIRNNLNHPMWDLMMKNVYSLNMSGIARDGFQLRVVYKDDKTGIDNPNLQEGLNTKDKPLVRLFGLDKLNQQLDPQPDGNFDFVEGTTIDSRFGKVIFPVLEPFGKSLEKYFVTGSENELIDKYVFYDLYDKTQADAAQQTRKTKFFLRVNATGSGAGGGFGGNGAVGGLENGVNPLSGNPMAGMSNGITGGGFPVTLPFGVDASTVVVSAGGVPLSQGTDYEVDVAIGTVRIINQSIMNSGREIRIDYERPDLFNNQIRTMVGGRFDYALSKDIRLGATLMKYKETPSGFLTRVAVGNEPTNNTIIGFDAGIRRKAPFLTRLVDKLPFIETKEASTFDFEGEYAQLIPGVAPRVNGNSFLDDFEGSRIAYDLSRQAIRWKLGATPDEFKFDKLNQFDLKNNFKRAKISAYNVDISLYGVGGGAGVGSPTNFNDADKENIFERSIGPQDIFKGKDITNVPFPVSVFDISYFPHERGPYNYNTDLDNRGLLKNPKQNFGAVTRAIPSDIDFDNANIEIMEFWMLSPFQNNNKGIVKDGFFNQNNTTGGKLEIHIGDISEDLIPDSQFNFENGISANNTTISSPRSSEWGFYPTQQFTLNAFENDDAARQKQDVGLDGMNNEKEAEFFKEKFIDKLPSNLSAEARAKILADPSADDYKYYFNKEFNESNDPNKKLIYRYKEAIGLENNSPNTNQTGAVTLSESSTNLPDMEDLNADNTVNDVEAYYKYTIDLKPTGAQKLDVGLTRPNFTVVDKVDNGDQGTWYLIRVPIRSGTPVGNINGFKSMRFIRMQMSEFEQPVVLRFAQFQLTSFQYRKYDKDISQNEKPGIEAPEIPGGTTFKVSTVSIEENQETSGTNEPFPYRTPPGFERDVDQTSTNNLQLNEQSLSLCVENLRPGDARAVFKNTGYDLLSYKNLRMFTHLEGTNGSSVDKKINAFLRIGTDLSENYYEIEKVSLTEISSTKKTNSATPEDVWPVENNFDIAFQELRTLKVERDQSSAQDISKKYAKIITLPSGKYNLTVVGRPDLSSVQTIMLGVKNPVSNTNTESFCVWMNELRVSGFDQTSGYAAVGKLNLKLADFATVTLTGSIKTFGFGGVQMRISERNRDVRSDYGIATNIALDKFFPSKWGLQLPLFLNYDNALITPKFDPLDPDMFLEDKLLTRGEGYRRQTDDRVIRRGINMSNVRKIRTGTGKKAHFYDIENFSASYAFNETERYSVLVDQYKSTNYRGGLAYTFEHTAKPWEPFKNSKKMNKPSLGLIKEFNFNPIPSTIMIRSDVERSYIKTQLRSADLTTNGQDPFFEKYFLWNRIYDLNWNLANSAQFNYNAVANAVIDEPEGEIKGNATKLDSIRANFRNLGRPKLFTQNMAFTWRIPLDKSTITDWLTADYNWKVGANYTAGAFGLSDENNDLYGNTVRNLKDQQITGKIDLVALYNKLKYLKFANTPDPKREIVRQSPGSLEEIPEENSKVVKKFTRLLMAIRGINYTIGLQESTILPGFLPAPKFFGLGDTYYQNNPINGNNIQLKTATMAPGLPFILGSQNINILEKSKNNGWLTKSIDQNMPFTQTRTKKIEFRTQIEPIADMQIQLEARWNRTDNYQEYYRPEVAGGEYKNLTPVRGGNFTMSYLSFLTAFKLRNKDGSSDNFNNFINYRSTILNRITAENKETTGGYNLTSQDILIPAFFAAYSGKDPKTVRFNPFRGIPLPNWNMNYKGLNKLGLFKKWFTTFEINHAYESTYSVGNFVSSLEYMDPNLLRFNQNNAKLHFLGFDRQFNYPFANKLNSTGQFVPTYMMSIISFTEKFGPFLGVNFRTKSEWTGRLEYNQDRNISLNLSNASVSELINKDWVITIGATKNNLRVPFKVNGKTVRLKNDVNFTATFTLRDQIATLRKIDALPVELGGQLMLMFRPQIQYSVNKNFNCGIYFDRMLNNPYVYNNFRRSTTQGGIQLRYTLAP